MNNKPLYIFWSASSVEEGKTVITQLLQKHFVACGSIIPNITSYFHWNGTIEESKEVKVILKTQERHFDDVSKMIRSLASYDTPEIVAFEASKVEPEFAQWLFDATSKNSALH